MDLHAQTHTYTHVLKLMVYLRAHIEYQKICTGRTVGKIISHYYFQFQNMP
jgi:hypothetical protein